MIDLSPVILSALEANAQIVTLLGGKNIYERHFPIGDVLPRITFFELTNFDYTDADDRPIESRISFQIDVWSLGETAEIAAEVDKVMKELNFRRTGTQGFYEEDTQIYHKGLRYSTVIMEGD